MALVVSSCLCDLISVDGWSEYLEPPTSPCQWLWRVLGVSFRGKLSSATVHFLRDCLLNFRFLLWQMLVLRGIIVFVSVLFPTPNSFFLKNLMHSDLEL